MPRMPAARGYQPGFATVQAPERVRAPQAPSVGSGLERLGQTLEGIGTDMGRRELRDREAALNLAERKAEETAREQERQRRRAESLDVGVKAVNFEVGAKQLKADLDEQLARGEIDQDKYLSELRLKTDELRNTGQRGLGPEANQEFIAVTARPRAQIDLGARQTIGAHTKRLAVARVDEAREAALRLAVTDLPRAQALLGGLYGSEGEAVAHLGAEAAQKQGQAAREAAAMIHFERRVVGARGDMKSLDALQKEIEGDGSLDPRQQTGHVASLQSQRALLRNQAIAAADRRERAADRALSEVEQLDSRGGPIDPAWLAPRIAAVKGTPAEARMTEILRGAAADAGLGTKSLPEQDAAIRQLQADIFEKGRTPARQKALDRAVRMRDAQRQDVKNDPWEAALKRQDFAEIPMLRTGTAAEFVASLEERRALQPIVEHRAGKSVVLTRPGEVPGVISTIKAFPIPQQAQWLGEMHRALGSTGMREFAAQAKDKDLSFAIAARLAAEEDSPQALHRAQLYLAGRKAREDKLVKVDERPEIGDEAQIRKRLSGATASPYAEDATVDAALNWYLARKAENQSPTYEQAIAEVAGNVMKYNDARIVLPRGMTENSARRAIAAIDEKAIEEAAAGSDVLFLGNLRVSPANVAEMVRTSKLRPFGTNRYRIQAGESFVTTDGVTPLLISLKEPAEAGGPRKSASRARLASEAADAAARREEIGQ